VPPRRIGVFKLSLAAIISLTALAHANERADALRIASEGARPPYNYFEGSELTGFEIELGRELCARMKRVCVFQAQDWDRMAKVAPKATGGFLGLGVMGYPMAGHLKAKGGHELTVYNRTAAKAESLGEEVRRPAARPRALRPRGRTSSSPASAMTTICAR
jgi:hypothetical protein